MMWYTERYTLYVHPLATQMLVAFVIPFNTPIDTGIQKYYYYSDGHKLTVKINLAYRIGHDNI
jgi:hypothetical protein